MKNKILLFLLLFGAGNVAAENRYFAVTKALNTTSGVTSVVIAMAKYETDCAPLRDGMIEGYQKSNEAMQIISAECLSDLPSEYMRAFRNKPIPGVMYIAYTETIWPFRILMYGVDKSWFSDQGCSVVANYYQSIDKNARCIYGEK